MTKNNNKKVQKYSKGFKVVLRQTLKISVILSPAVALQPFELQGRTASFWKPSNHLFVVKRVRVWQDF